MDSENRVLQRKVSAGLMWCGPAGVVFMGGGMLLLAGLIPPTDPSATAEQVKAFYTGNLTGIRLGTVFSIIGVSLLAPWSISLTGQLRRTVGGLEVLGQVQVVAIAISWTTGLLATLVWALTSFRPDEIPAEMTRTLNDAGWFLLLFPWPPFSVWFVAVAVVILNDRSAAPLFPRWSAYLSIWVAVLIATGSLLVFFKSGPFAYNGIITFWAAFIGFFIWVLVMTFLVRKAIPEQHSPQPIGAVAEQVGT